MTLDGHTIGAAAAVLAYTVLSATYFARIVKKYPGDRGIRFGSLAVVVFLCIIAILRTPELGGIHNWFLPILFFTEMVLVCLSGFFLVTESVEDVRKSRKKKHQ